MKVSDSQLYARLAGMLDGSASIDIAPANPGAQSYRVDVRLELHDNHRGDSPDAVLHLSLSVRHPRLPDLALQIPIPIEGEKAGIGAALRDLQKFAEREHFVQRLPMLVVGGSGNPARRVESIRMPARVEIAQVPYRVLTE